MRAGFAGNEKIVSVKARQIIDSRAMPTIEVEAATKNFSAIASAPSGASKGSFEAVELRDCLKPYGGKSVMNAVRGVNNKIAGKLKGMNPRGQKKIDEALIGLDGTKGKSKLGGNAILASSVCCARLGAQSEKKELFEFIGEICGHKRFHLPVPCFNVINGGLHAWNELSIQEYWVIPEEKRFADNLRVGVECYNALKKRVAAKYGRQYTAVGDEGGFAVPDSNPRAPVELILDSTGDAGYGGRVSIGIDVAASVLFRQGKYELEKRMLEPNEMIEFYSGLVKDYGVKILEDPFAESDYTSWIRLNHSLGKKALIAGDDLTATNSLRLQVAREEKWCNSVIVKPNQAGTVSEAVEFAVRAKKFGWKTIAAHRSGDTEDAFIADFAVGTQADYAKFGAPCRGERTAKYNRLLRIEEIV
ncbi:MAG: enolase [archaeon]